MGMFEQFPYTNFHELNLDWLIDQINKIKSTSVLSVNGQTGDVVLYQNPEIKFPDINSGAWRMVRTASGNNVGIAFNEDYLFLVNGETLNLVYSANHQPPYPVRSVNNQTGDVTLYPDAGIRFPDTTENYMNMRRQIQTNGTDNIVGLEVKENRAYRIKDTQRYEMYDAGNPPPYPVTSINGQTGDINIVAGVSSVNGQTGAVVLAIPFDAPLTDSIWIAREASTDHTAGMARETVDGTASVYLVTTGTDVQMYLHFVSADDQTSYTRKLLTTDDIPATGVYTVNGLAGTVVLYGDDIYLTNGSTETIKDVLDELKDDLAIIEDTNTAVHNITIGHFVCWHGYLYTANANIAIGDTLSLTNLTPVNKGGLNDLQDHVFLFPGDVISDTSFEILPSIISASLESIYLSIPVNKNLEYITTATINELKAGMRIPDGGYLNGNNYDYLTNADSITVTIDKTAGMIKLQMNKTGGWSSSVPNNTPLVATVNYTITLN